MNNPAILIAEVDEILCKDLKGRLFHHGFEVIEALDQTIGETAQCYTSPQSFVLLGE